MLNLAELNRTPSVHQRSRSYRTIGVPLTPVIHGASRSLHIRAERAETDLDAARTENQRLAEELARTANAEADPEPADATSPRPRTSSRAKKTSNTRAPRSEA